MIFSSITFLYYFLPVLLLVYFIVPNKYKNLVLFIASLVFYFYGEPIYIFLMLFTIFVTYICALLMDKSKENKKVFLIISILISLALLGLFKYSDFFIENVNQIFKTNIALLNLALPIGISFYTFQLLSYIIDVYNGKVKVQTSFLKLATYVSLFPQLIAGPIVRYETIESELENRKHSFDDFSYGASRFTIGLAKKVLIANALGQLCSIYSSSEKSVLFCWIYAISYSLQVYFDFSAYSDMAIGLGRIFGFHFLENFNYPFISKSITEFWRRWHISLGSWFRDYVYIPLGGNKKGNLILFRNIFIVWFLTGMWHGASWNFIIWGLLFGIMLVIEKFFLLKYLGKIPSFIARVYVLFIVMISFIIFDGTSVKGIYNNIIGLFGGNNIPLINLESIYYLKSYLIIIIIAIMGSTPLIKDIVLRLKKNEKIERIVNIFEIIVVFLLLLFTTAYLIDNSYNPFLYFRF